jgi:hypothetical protein
VGWYLFPLFLMGLTAVVNAQEVFDPSSPLNKNPQSGIEVGQRIPAFRAVDGTGKSWDFDSIKGPKGALLLFHRSADW